SAPDAFDAKVEELRLYKMSGPTVPAAAKRLPRENSGRAAGLARCEASGSRRGRDGVMRRGLGCATTAGCLAKAFVQGCLRGSALLVGDGLLVELHAGQAVAVATWPAVEDAEEDGGGDPSDVAGEQTRVAGRQLD